ncbi:MAG: hypothetical protein ACQEUZ_07595 [Pseudomonadota bacterium]
MRNLLLAIPALVLGVSLSPPHASAGPWTEPEGSRFLSVSGGPDPDGPTGLRRDLHFAFGWREGVTLGLSVTEQHETGDPGFRGRVEGFVRQRLWRGEDGAVAAFQGEFGAGLGGSGDSPDTTSRLLVGKGYATPLGGGWSEGGLGWRMESGGADRLLASVATGLRPAAGWTAMAGAEADLMADRAATGWEVLRLTGTLARDMGRGMRIYLRAEAPVWGRKISEGLDLRLGVWRSF